MMLWFIIWHLPDLYEEFAAVVLDQQHFALALTPLGLAVISPKSEIKSASLSCICSKRYLKEILFVNTYFTARY